MHAVRAEHVGELVRVGDDGRGAEREDESRELVRKELRRLEVHVRVDEAGDDEPPGRVECLQPLVLAEARDEAVDDRDVGLEPLLREDREDLSAADDEVGGLVASRDREPASQRLHRASVMLSLRPISSSRAVL